MNLIGLLLQKFLNDSNRHAQLEAKLRELSAQITALAALAALVAKIQSSQATQSQVAGLQLALNQQTVLIEALGKQVLPLPPVAQVIKLGVPVPQK